jgi:hypothetical protein
MDEILAGFCGCDLAKWLKWLTANADASTDTEGRQMN